jgi:cell division protein FtsB
VRLITLFSVLLGLIGYVASEAVGGAHGLLANRQIHARVDTLSKDLAQLKAQHTQLERDAALLKDKPGDTSLVDEQARALLDLARPTDIVIVNGEK